MIYPLLYHQWIKILTARLLSFTKERTERKLPSAVVFGKVNKMNKRNFQLSNGRKKLVKATKESEQITYIATKIKITW